LKNIFIKSVKRMWPLSLVLLTIGIYKFVSNYSTPLDTEGLIRVLLGLLILVLTPPGLVAVVVYFDKSSD
jgi:hypothetical protein